MATGSSERDEHDDSRTTHGVPAGAAKDEATAVPHSERQASEVGPLQGEDAAGQVPARDKAG